MSKNTTVLLVVWNVLLSALLGWSLLRGTEAPVAPASTEMVEASSPSVPDGPTMTLDTAVRQDARIAFFLVDSLRNKLDLLSENRRALGNEEKRLQDRMDKEMTRAQRRSQEIMAKDPYSTMAEREENQRELMKLETDMRQLAAESEERLMRMGDDMAVNFSKQLQAFLEQYNASQGYDYIISVEPGGQVWVGNRGLDITDDVVAGMNLMHREAGRKPAAQ